MFEELNLDTTAQEIKFTDWDVKIGDPVPYFDPELSYELTGYRPITENQALDFNPEWFRDSANRKLSTGVYSPFHKKSLQNKKFWQEEHERIKNGLTINGYTITGDHYHFLNYFQLKNTQGVEKAGGGRGRIFPKFLVENYKFFHYVELASKLYKDALFFKARAVGASEMCAAMGAAKYTVLPNYLCMYTAFSADLLTNGVWTKVAENLDYLNTDTESGMTRARAVNQEFRKLAAKLDSNRQIMPKSHMSEIVGIIADNPRKVRGLRADRIFYEEAGSNPHLDKSWSQGLALVELHGDRIGMRIALGTGGDEGPYLAGLEKMFLNPTVYAILPYRHNHTPDKSYVVTGFFTPSWAAMLKYIDKRGIVDEQKAKEHYKAIAKTKESDPEEVDRFWAEYCFYPEQALSRKGKNNFPRQLLVDRYADIVIHKKTPKVFRGRLAWEHDKEGVVKGVKFIEDLSGNLFVTEDGFPHLYKDEATGEVPRNLFVGGTDGIDVGEDESVVGKDGSKFCTVIKRRHYGLYAPKYVAFYLDRPKLAKEAYEESLKLLYWYNCKTNIEATRLEFKTFLVTKKQERFLMKRPVSNIKDPSDQKETSLWGTTATPSTFKHGLNLIREYLLEYTNYIDFDTMINQLLNYSDEARGKLDIVVAMMMCEIGDEDMINSHLVVQKPEIMEWVDFGYYTNENGERVYGELPNNDLRVSIQYKSSNYTQPMKVMLPQQDRLMEMTLY